MELWFHSCEFNPDIDFILLTDDVGVLDLRKPVNVIVIQMSWQECVHRIESLYDFKIPLVYKYKICDLRPAYGEIFREYLEDYEFWGHMDVSDTIFGNLRMFITDDLLKAYDKIHMFGHLVIYRNSDENNARYRIPLKSGKSYRDAFSVEETVCFDDMYNEISVNRIFQENGFKKIDRVPGLVVDILPYWWSFWLSGDKGEKIPRIIEWNKGRLNEITLKKGAIRYREVGYVHFQKRRIKIASDIKKEHYYLIPNCIIPADSISVTPEWLIEITKDKIYLDPAIGRFRRIVNYGKHPKVFLRKIQEQRRHRTS